MLLRLGQPRNWKGTLGTASRGPEPRLAVLATALARSIGLQNQAKKRDSA
ncbi:hypothetical protein [Burkholderia oklahomensis]|nr:hypothetical protein [Burkholderia oklahomensis]